jgi:hypothetical protein
MILLFLILFFVPTPQLSALTLPNAPPKVVAIDWDGMEDMDGDGTESFMNLGETITASLHILCNTNKGYNITFSSSNATAATASNIANGGNLIQYTGSIDLSGILHGNISTNSLDLTGSAQSLKVRFNRGQDVMPMDSSTANIVLLSLTLDGFQGALFPMGTYTDVITTTAAVN